MAFQYRMVFSIEATIVAGLGIMCLRIEGQYAHPGT